MSKVIGIDLGTTNSCVAVIEGDTPTVITNSEGYRTTPSVVAFTKNKERLVGDTARRQASVNSDRTIFSIKRYMGTDYKKKIDGKPYTPQEISAYILMKLKKDAENFLGEEVTDAQIEELKAGKEKLMNSAQKLFAKMYEQTQGAGAQGAGPDMGAQGAGNANDDVVDGDYKEV